MIFIAGFLVVAALVGGGVLVFALSRRDKEPALAGGGTWPGSAGPAATPPQIVGGEAPIGHRTRRAAAPGAVALLRRHLRTRRRAAARLIAETAVSPSRRERSTARGAENRRANARSFGTSPIGHRQSR